MLSCLTHLDKMAQRAAWETATKGGHASIRVRSVRRKTIRVLA